MMRMIFLIVDARSFCKDLVKAIKRILNQENKLKVGK